MFLKQNFLLFKRSGTFTSLDSLTWIGLYFSIDAKSDSLGHFNLSRRQTTGSSIILELFYRSIILKIMPE